MSGNRTVPEFLQGRPEDLMRKLAQVLNGMMKGQQNNDFTLTLGADPATSSEVAVPFARKGQVALLAPMSAEAAADFAAGTTYAVPENGRIVVHHAAGSGSREYGVVLQG